MPARAGGPTPAGIYGGLRSAVLRPDVTSWPLLVAPVAMSIGAGLLALLIFKLLLALLIFKLLFALLIFKLPLIKMGANRIVLDDLRLVGLIGGPGGRPPSVP